MAITISRSIAKPSIGLVIKPWVVVVYTGGHGGPVGWIAALLHRIQAISSYLY